MINLSFFTDLMVLPLRFILMFPFIPKGALRQRLMGWIWKITRNENDAGNLVGGLYPNARNEGRQLIDQVLKESRDCGHLSRLLIIDYHFTHDEAYARQWIATARAESYHNLPMLHYLELIMCNPWEQQDEVLKLSEIIINNTQFPPAATYMALYNRMLVLLRKGDIEPAEEIVERLSSIKTDNDTLRMQISIRFAKNNTEIKDLLAKMQFANENQQHFFVSIAWLDTGNEEAAVEELKNCDVEFLTSTRFSPQLQPLINKALSSRLEVFGAK